MPTEGNWVNMQSKAPKVLLKGKLMKQGIVFENCRMTTLDSTGILRYTAIGDNKVRAALDLKRADITLRFMYTQKKEGKVNAKNEL
jgi:hypothetical protein